MTKLNTILKCKICKKKGKNIYQIFFNDKKIFKFFHKEYSLKIAKFLKLKLKNKKFILLKCKDCEFIWQKNAPNKSFINKIYDQIIDRKKSFNKAMFKLSKKEIQKNKYEISFIKCFLKKNELNVLDFGSGWGEWLKSLEYLNVKRYGFEISEIRKKYLKNIGVTVLDSKNLLKFRNYFDYIRLEQVLEHVDDLNFTMKNLSKIIKKGGVLFIGVPNGNSEINDNNIIIQKGPIQPLEHLNCFNNKSLTLLAKKHGFRSIGTLEIFINSLSYLNLNLISFKTFLKDNFLSINNTRIRFVKI